MLGARAVMIRLSPEQAAERTPLSRTASRATQSANLSAGAHSRLLVWLHAETSVCSLLPVREVADRGGQSSSALYTAGLPWR